MIICLKECCILGKCRFDMEGLALCRKYCIYALLILAMKDIYGHYDIFPNVH